MKVSIKDGVMFVELALARKPRPSKSEKSTVVASTSGFVPTEAVIDGLPVMISLNAVIRKAE